MCPIKASWRGKYLQFHFSLVPEMIYHLIIITIHFVDKEVLLVTNLIDTMNGIRGSFFIPVRPFNRRVNRVEELYVSLETNDKH